MGQYAASLAIPANTLEGDKVHTEITLHEPFIIGYDVYFPPGCAGLCYVALVVNGKQFAPADGSADRYFHGEGSKTWYGKARLATGQTETEIKIIGYNIDDTYLHTPIISINTDQA
jgi:hypothetical protein